MADRILAMLAIPLKCSGDVACGSQAQETLCGDFKRVFDARHPATSPVKTPLGSLGIAPARIHDQRVLTSSAEQVIGMYSTIQE